MKASCNYCMEYKPLNVTLKVKKVDNSITVTHYCSCNCLYLNLEEWWNEKQSKLAEKCL